MSLRDEIAADLAEPFSTDDFGEPVTWGYEGGETPITAIYFDQYAAALAEMVPIENAKIHFLCRTDEVPDIENGDTITQGEIVWNVIEVSPPNAHGTVRVYVSLD